MTGHLIQQPAAGDRDIGLYRAGDFRLTDGRCTDCAAIPQALWYFRDQAIAVPRPGLPVAGFARGATAFDDVARWAADHAPGTPADYPTLIWVGSPAVLRGARLDAAGREVTVDGRRLLCHGPGHLGFLDVGRRSLVGARCAVRRNRHSDRRAA